LLGNPINTWSSTASIVIFGIVAVIYLLRWQRHYVDFTPAYIDHIHFAGLYPLLAWGLHYVPFFIMGRYLPYQTPSNVSVLYVHHYLPALYFAIMVEGFVFDHFTRNLNQTTKWAVFTIAYIAVAGTFIHFRDISFGMEGDSAQWKHLNWLRTWRIADQDATD
jgi:dolichyl-phosphate-mannose-protein mannosyltransferase